MTQILQSSRVKMVKAAWSAFIQLVTGQETDENTLYFVNESGFDPTSLGNGRGDLYLGDKLIGVSREELAVISQNLMRIDGNVFAINAITNTTSCTQDIPLSDFGGAKFFDLNLHATLQNPGQSPVNVEVWMERGHYEKVEKEGIVETVWQTDEHIAATQVFIPVYSGHSLNATCCASIAGQLVGPYQAEPCPYVRVCFAATGQITVCSATPQNNLPKATALTIRCWTPVLSA